MYTRWAPGFTIVELLIIIVTIAILATISFVGYTGIQKQAVERTVQADLEAALAEIRQLYQKTGEYPATVPATVATTADNTLELTLSEPEAFYENLSAVQQGVLLHDICREQLAAGQGSGVDNGGVTQNYVIACDVWDATSYQIEAWQTRRWSTPVTEANLVDYAQSYISHDQQWNPTADDVVRAFYLSMVETFKRRGGTFPVESFWDFWANGSNGGVVKESLPTPTLQSNLCVEGSSARYPDIRWHFTQTLRLKEGGC